MFSGGWLRILQVQGTVAQWIRARDYGSQDGGSIPFGPTRVQVQFGTLLNSRTYGVYNQ